MIKVGDRVDSDHRTGGVVARFLGAYAIVGWADGAVTAALASTLTKVERTKR